MFKEAFCKEVLVVLGDNLFSTPKIAQVRGTTGTRRRGIRESYTKIGDAASMYLKFLDFSSNSKKMGLEGEGNGANTKYIDQQPQKWRPQRFIWGFPRKLVAILAFRMKTYALGDRHLRVFYSILFYSILFYSILFYSFLFYIRPSFFDCYPSLVQLPPPSLCQSTVYTDNVWLAGRGWGEGCWVLLETIFCRS